jgi:DNA-binding transcriptional ArsR family regulator
MHRALNSNERRLIILKHLNKGKFTTNEIIDREYRKNCTQFMNLPDSSKKTFLTKVNDPNVYTHINKETASLKRNGLVDVVGTKTGKKGVTEQILTITDEGKEFYANQTVKKIPYLV